MEVMDAQVEPVAFVAFIRSRGYQAKPVLNTIAAGEGKLLVVCGYELIGPRRNRGFMPMQDGYLSIFSARLWCDGVDYATAKIAEKRAFWSGAHA